MATSPAGSFDLTRLNQHVKERIDVLTTDETDRDIIKKRLKHIYDSNHTYTIGPSRETIASMIDHTILKPDARLTDVQTLCQEAIDHGFSTVCVNGSRVAECKKYFASNCTSSKRPPGICSVIGFPLGAMDSHSKAAECARVIQLGASEVDMVISIGALKDGNFHAVRQDIEAVFQEVQSANASSPLNEKRLLKVILETCLLTDLEIIDVTILCVLVGVDFVKTSTGFSTGGAVPAQVRLMKSIVGDFAQVKASGGIRDAETARRMIENGATRLGCSASVAIAKGDAAKPSTGSY